LEALIIFAALIFGMFVYNKIQEPKRLEEWAEKTCSFMKFGEVLVHIARLRSQLKEYGFLSKARESTQGGSNAYVDIEGYI
jgi:hypothetical protein